jgi:hypothetical protein
MNGSSHPDHENLLYTIDSRLRASARHGGAGSCFEFCSPIRRGGVPSGAAAIILSEGESCNNSLSYLNKTIFMRNAQLPAKRSWGFHPPPLWLPPNAIDPELVLRHHRSQRRGGMGGQALSPPSSYRCYVFHIIVREILRSHFSRIFYPHSQFFF